MSVNLLKSLKILVPLALVAAVGYGCYQYIFAGIRPTGAAGNVVVDPDPVLMKGEYSPENIARVKAAEDAAHEAANNSSLPDTKADTENEAASPDPEKP